MSIRECKECGNEVSMKAELCPNCGALPEGKTAGCSGRLGAVVIGFIVLVVVGSLKDTGTTSRSSSKSPAKSRPAPQREHYTETEKEALYAEFLDTLPSRRSLAPKHVTQVLPVLTYEIVGRDIRDTRFRTQINLDAVVSGSITEAGLQELLQGLYDEAIATGIFKYQGGKPTHAYITLYACHKHFLAGTGQWLANLSKTGSDSQVYSRVNTELMSQLTATPEVKFGLSETVRKQIYQASVRAEDRARIEAEQTYPLWPPPRLRSDTYDDEAQLVKQARLMGELEEKYMAEVTREYGLTGAQRQAIALEGGEKF